MAHNSESDSTGPWMHAWYDPLSNIKTVSSCVKLADLHGGINFNDLYRIHM
jgi:hypothetical protein